MKEYFDSFDCQIQCEEVYEQVAANEWWFAPGRTPAVEITAEDFLSSIKEE